MPGSVPPRAKQKLFKNEGRACPIDYKINADAFSGPAQIHADVLYVVGGLYGNPFALRAIDNLIEEEKQSAQKNKSECTIDPKKVLAVFNGDMHWFDKTAENFEAIETQASKYLLLVGNVEAELRRQESAGVGCGCAYPDCTADDAVSRSNRIHFMLSSEIEKHPCLKKLLENRPATATVDVCGQKVAITHGDEKFIGGWECSRESLEDITRQYELNTWMRENHVDILATTHTCAPSALAIESGIIINNGAAGLPNFKGENFGIVIRIAPYPNSDALFRAQQNGVFVEAIPVRYDQAAYLNWFDALWSRTSPAAVSYRARIVNGVDDYIENALLGGFVLAEGAKDDSGSVVNAQVCVSEEDVMYELAHLVYFEDRLPHESLRYTNESLSTLQLNICAKCNLSCTHCHVKSSPARTEEASHDVLCAVLDVLRTRKIPTLDITGGAPEMHSEFEWFLRQAAPLTQKIIVRTNLVILASKKYEPLMDVYKELKVELVASLPHVFASESETQRGNNTFATTLNVLQKLNELGYGTEENLKLNLVFNPLYPVLPAKEAQLDAIYKECLAQRSITYNNTLAIANNPIGRYGESLLEEGQLKPYIELLEDSFNEETCQNLMCRNQLSVLWDGTVYDCDFNAALNLCQQKEDTSPLSIFDLAAHEEIPLKRKIIFGNHCYACSAGHGSSCSGTIIKE